MCLWRELSLAAGGSLAIGDEKYVSGFSSHLPENGLSTVVRRTVHCANIELTDGLVLTVVTFTSVALA